MLRDVHKNGERNMGKPAPKKANEVEDHPCPMWQGNHQLINLKSGVCCIKCGVSWAELDMELNGVRP